MDASASARAVSKPYKHACERCRNSKLKCTLESVVSTGKCDRCLAAGAECRFEPLAPRQKRRRADARIATLEKELRTMRAVLDNLRDSQVTEQTQDALPYRSTRDTCRAVGSPEASSVLPDAVSNHLAKELFHEFVDFILPQYPLVDIQESFESLRDSKPMLFLAMVTAASGTREPSLFKLLHSHLVRQITEKVLIEGERSIELIQAIMILQAWYYPPDDLRRLNFYQWIHVAGTMALQLGLGGAAGRQKLDLDRRHVERWRTMFAVFQSCASVAMSFRRQCLVNFTPAAGMILDAFDSVHSSANDERLVAWVRLQRINQEAEEAQQGDAAFSLDGLLDRFDQWKGGLRPGILNGKCSRVICSPAYDASFFECSLLLLQGEAV